MSASLFIGTKGIGSNNASTTTYIVLPSNNNSASNTKTLEASASVPIRRAASFKNLTIRVISNDRGNSTFKFRKNSANGNQSIAIPSSTTGEFQDSSNTDTVSTGDIICGQLITGAGGTTFVNTITAVTFIPNIGSQTIGRLTNNNSSSINNVTAASTTYFFTAGAAVNTTNTNTEFVNQVEGIIQHLSCYVSSNTRGTATTLGNRKNNASGSLSLSITASTTGLFEDTTNQDTLIVGDTTGFYATTGTGIGNTAVEFISASLVNQSGKWQIASSDSSNVNAAATVNFIVSNNNSNATEANNQAKSQNPYFINNLYLLLSANTVTASSTFKVRLNAANTNVSISIPSSTTGTFRDQTNVASPVSASEISLQIIAGATGTSFSIAQFGVVFVNVSGGAGFFGGGI